ACKRIKERDIDIELIEQVIKEPLEVIDVKFGRKAACGKLDDHYLVVIFEEQKDEIVILDFQRYSIFQYLKTCSVLA
ncbi:MAG: DUF4258 domain-containing protein, partial [Candidatus Methanoperedens sp.]|nr:DUF4258 domain-containing protein [Candidatus Methanoperedens sp.]